MNSGLDQKRRFIGRSSPPMTHPEYMGRRYMPALDGLRAIAVALVITCHLHTDMWTPLSGYVGVTIFFVLSGYLITRLSLREEKDLGQLNLPAFYIRRTFRIFPLYYLVLAAYCLLILRVKLWPEKVVPFVHSLTYYITYLQEIPFWRNNQGPHHLPPFYHSWSLGIEEKFYLVWPLLLAATTRARTALRMGIVASAILIFVVQGILTERSLTYHLETYGFILMGVFLALLLSRPAPYLRFNHLARFFVPVSLATVLVTQFYLMPFSRLRGLSTLYAIAVTLLLGALVSSKGAADRVLSSPRLVTVGKLSYAIYLVHVLCIGAVEHLAKPEHGKFVGLLAYLGALALSIALALALHQIVELPMIRLGRHLSGRLLHEKHHKPEAPLVPGAAVKSTGSALP